MVDSKNVIFFFAGGKTFYPPGIAVFFLFFPVINGVSPKLAVFGKIIRRNARNVARMSFLIKIEKFRRSPDVAAVIRNIDGKVADYFDSAFVGVIFKVLPLAVEFILKKLGYKQRFNYKNDDLVSYFFL